MPYIYVLEWSVSEIRQFKSRPTCSKTIFSPNILHAKYNTFTMFWGYKNGVTRRKISYQYNVMYPIKCCCMFS